MSSSFPRASISKCCTGIPSFRSSPPATAKLCSRPSGCLQALSTRVVHRHLKLHTVPYYKPPSPQPLLPHTNIPLVSISTLPASSKMPFSAPFSMPPPRPIKALLAPAHIRSFFSHLCPLSASPNWFFKGLPGVRSLLDQRFPTVLGFPRSHPIFPLPCASHSHTPTTLSLLITPFHSFTLFPLRGMSAEPWPFFTKGLTMRGNKPP